MGLDNIYIISDEEVIRRREEWQKNNKDTKLKSGDFVRIALTENGVVEHPWVQIDTVISNIVYGLISNDLMYVKSLKYGDEVTFNRDKIEQLLNEENRLPEPNEGTDT